MNSTSFFYAHTDQWRYEKLSVAEILSPLADPKRNSGSLIDFNVRAERMSCEDPDHPDNFPRNLFVWRSNLLGSSAKGHEYFLKHLLGATNGVQGPETGTRNEEIQPRGKGPEGKLDLLVTIDFRMSTTCLYSDIVLPTATWYEKNDLNTSDMHPFIHPLSAAVDPVWQSRSDWEIYKGFAKKFSELAPGQLGVEKDVVLTPLMHDTPGELGQPFEPKDWKKGECEPVPGKTMPAITVVERDYPNVYQRFTALGPLMARSATAARASPGTRNARWIS